MRIKFLILLVIFILLTSCVNNNKLSTFYYRLDKNIVKGIEIDKEYNKVYLYNWDKVNGMQKWNFTYTIEKNNLVLKNVLDDSITKYEIKDNKLTGNVISENGYINTTYKKGTKKDFNDLIKKFSR